MLVWNRIPTEEWEEVVVLEKGHYIALELAWHITDHESYYISESSVCRILAQYGLIRGSDHIQLSASDSFKDMTMLPNQMW